MSVLAEWPCDTWRTVGFRLRCARDCEWPRVVVCTCPVRVRQACLWAEPRPPSGSAAEETRGSEQHPRSLGVDVERARPWAEAAARPRPARDSQSPLSPHKGQPAFCPLLSASPGKPSWPCVRLLHAPTVRLSYPFSICPGAQRRGGGVGGGQGHRKCLVGACGPGQSWQPPQEERTFRGRRKASTPPFCHHPPLPSASKEKGAGGGGGGLKPAESAPCCLGLLGGQSGPEHWTHRPPPPASHPTDQPLHSSYCPPPTDRPPPQTSLPSWAGQGGLGGQAGLCLSSGYSCLALGPE